MYQAYLRDELADDLGTHDLVMEVQLVLLELKNGPVVDLQLADHGRVVRVVRDLRQRFLRHLLVRQRQHRWQHRWQLHVLLRDVLLRR